MIRTRLIIRDPPHNLEFFLVFGTPLEHLEVGRIWVGPSCHMRKFRCQASKDMVSIPKNPSMITYWPYLRKWYMPWLRFPHLENFAKSNNLCRRNTSNSYRMSPKEIELDLEIFIRTVSRSILLEVTNQSFSSTLKNIYFQRKVILFIRDCCHTALSSGPKAGIISGILFESRVSVRKFERYVWFCSNDEFGRKQVILGVINRY